MTITRKRHAFEGRSLAVIGSIRRRGVLLLLAGLPDGSRALIPADWTDWRTVQAGRMPADDAADGGHDLGKLGDLLHLRKLIDALRGRHIESVPCKESSHAIEPGLSRPARSLTQLLSNSPIGGSLEQLDEASRVEALEILARLIARMLAREATKEVSDE